MICTPCARAADQRLGRDQHCDDDKCMCGHRVDRYRPKPDHEPTLNVVYATPPLLYAACDEGRHIAHLGLTCDEYEADRAAMRTAWDRLMAPVNEELAKLHADTTED